MYLLEIPFNVMTGMITSLTVGLGVAYSIHMSERYSLELKRTGSVWEAMSRTVTGTGGALLGSAATTVGGFGVLAFAILPPLQQFGDHYRADDHLRVPRERARPPESARRLDEISRPRCLLPGAE